MRRQLRLVVIYSVIGELTVSIFPGSVVPDSSLVSLKVHRGRSAEECTLPYLSCCDTLICAAEARSCSLNVKCGSMCEESELKGV